MAKQTIAVADKPTLDKTYENTEKLINTISQNPIYGFIEHMDDLNPNTRIEYTGANKDYTPLSVDLETGQASYNSWIDFPWLRANKPYMVHSDGTPDYQLDENDYTKREDGTASDVENTSYDGGAFAWCMKIYKQEYVIGSDRVVNFSITKRDGFEPVGFIDSDNHELEGLWIPMFYGSVVDGKMKSISGTQPDYNKTTDQQKTAIDAFGTRARFFGGAIVQTLIDLMILFAKTSNLQAAYGYGNCNGHDESLAPTNGVKPNAVIGGGQFFGTNDLKSLNKIFHSIVLGSYQQWMRDPYVVNMNGKIKVSKNYNYDVTGESYADTGITYSATVSGEYPHNYKVINNFGALPIEPYKGSSILGGCDGLWTNIDIATVSARLGSCGNGLICGSRALSFYFSASGSAYNLNAALLLLPPVGVSA